MKKEKLNTIPQRLEFLRFQEQKALDVILGLALFVYIGVQICQKGMLTDSIFLVMITVATVFLNFRQENLYEALIVKEDGKDFFVSLRNKIDADSHIKNIFWAKENLVVAFLFATVFCTVMWNFQVYKEHLMLRCTFLVLLFIVNFSTGLAIVRLFRYFYFNFIWIYNVTLETGAIECCHMRFVQKIRSKVLFTAVTYCTISLSSILFTDIPINFIIIFYTIFAISLIVLILAVTEKAMYDKVKNHFNITLDKINSEIAVALDTVLLSKMEGEANMAHFDELVKIKEYLQQQRYAKIDFSKILSCLGLLFITVIPVLLQWFLDYLG